MIERLRDGLLTFLDVSQIFCLGIANSFEVVVGMIAHGVSGFYYPSEDIGVLVDILPYHKEGSLYLISVKDLQHAWCDLGNGSVVKGEIDNSPSPGNGRRESECTVRVQALRDMSQGVYHARDEAPRIAASESLSTDTETGILPFHIGIRLSSIASRIGSMIQCPALVSPPKRMIASGEEKWT